MKSDPLQLRLPFHPPDVKKSSAKAGSTELNAQMNKLDSGDRAFHDWYRFVLSFPPHLVRNYIQEFGLDEGQTLLDPFCGTGTTLVESKRCGIRGVGLEANPFARFASSVKINWEIDPESLRACAQEVASTALKALRAQGIEDNRSLYGNCDSLPLRMLRPEAARLLIKDSISPLPLHKALVLLECLKKHAREPYYNHVLLAFANALVFSISNLRFGPEVGVGKAKRDVPVIACWLSEATKIANDLRFVAGRSYPVGEVHLADARTISEVIAPQSIDGVITSPPYPNEKDYTRTTRLESVMLGFINNMEELRSFKKQLIRSNTRGVYVEDDDDRWIAKNGEIRRIADAIEERRLDLGKTSGFEKLYGKVARLYFGGIMRHLSELRTVLRPGARLAYVVGDQASYLRVMIRTGQLFADIALELGYEVLKIDLFRTRFSTATKEDLREEVVVLRWPGQEG
jgi:tRNA G10  N-methylase Trm11